MAEYVEGAAKKKNLTIENFMTEEEKITSNRTRLNELEVLRSELNSGKLFFLQIITLLVK